jgi:protein involved in polysaccharide export with SLBB domain
LIEPLDRREYNLIAMHGSIQALKRATLISALLVAPLLASVSAYAQQAPVNGARGAIEAANGRDARPAPGDQVLLSIWREPELSGAFTIGDDGVVMLPRLGAVQATRLPIAVLQDSLRAAYSSFVLSPSVGVSVLRRVGVHGEIRRPDLYMIDLTMTLREVIASAGGLTELADPRRIVLIRDGQQIDVGTRGGSGVRTVELRSGDQIIVGRRSWISMNTLAVVSTTTGLLTLVAALFFR